MKSIRFRLLIAAMAVLLGTAIAKAQTTDEATAPPPPMHGHGYAMHGHDHMMGFFSKALNLTDDQKAQMKTIMQKEHPAMKPLMQQQRQIDQQLRQYVEGTYDEAKVRALAAQKSQIEVELTVAHTRIHNEMYQLLTTDQRAQLKEMKAKHEARMQSRMHEAPPAAPEQ
jgi:Spy/CpxP family protein refolding chaperone